MNNEIPPIALSAEHTYTCSICGAPDNLGYYSPDCELLDEMQNAQICYKCAFWKHEIRHPTPHREIIGGNCYIIHPYHEDLTKRLRTVTDAECFVYHPDRSVYRSYSLYLIGKIPDRFVHELPDTAKFLPARAFRKLLINDFVCKAKGCWDRYNCLRYDMSCEKDGPFNLIPAYHQPGDEECESFINKNDLFI